MTSLDANALETDAEALAFLRDVLGTAPRTPPQSRRQAPTASAEPSKPAMPLTRTTRRLGLAASTALIGIVIAAAPAKSTVLGEQNAPPAATETRREAPRETPPPSRPVRTVTRYAGLDADSPACPRIRRKLWVEGEGWIVRSVTRC